MTLPTFFVIGAAKAGSTSLHHYLDLHPEIQMTPRKDPRFFAGPESGVPYPRQRIGQLEHYEALFDPTIAVRGDASNDYSMHPLRQGVPERIKALVPDARFIYLVRDPIARTMSHYQMRVAFEGERRVPESAFFDPTYAYRGCYVYPSMYATQVERYLSNFAEESVLVIDQAQLRLDRRSTLSSVFAFLSIDETFHSDRFDKELNGNRERVYPRGYERVMEEYLAPLARVTPRRVRSLRRSTERLLLPRLRVPELEPEVRARLQALFEPEVERLRALTGMDFATWSL